MKVSPLNADFSSQSADLHMVQRGLRTKATKRGTLLQSGYFTYIGSSSMKTVADRHKLPAYHDKH